MSSLAELQSLAQSLAQKNRNLQEGISNLHGSNKHGNRRSKGHHGGTPKAEGDPPRISNQQRTISSLKAIEGCILALEDEVQFKTSESKTKFEEHVAAIKEIQTERDQHQRGMLTHKEDRISNAKKATILGISDNVLIEMLTPEQLKTYKEKRDNLVSAHDAELEANRVAALPKGPGTAASGIDTTELMRELNGP
jgi:hypothetical protein